MRCNSAGLGSKAHLACAALPSKDPGVSPTGNHTVSSKTSWSLAMPPCPATTAQVGGVAHRTLGIQTPQAHPGRKG